MTALGNSRWGVQAREFLAQPTGPCPCECNHGGFCGGCGHAGCGGRRSPINQTPASSERSSTR